MSAKSASLVLHPGDGHGVHDVAQVLLVVAVAVVILRLLGVMNQLLDVLRRSALVTDVSEKSDTPATFDELTLKLCLFTIVQIPLLAPHTEEVVVGPERTVLTHRLRGPSHNDSTVLTPTVLR